MLNKNDDLDAFYRASGLVLWYVSEMGGLFGSWSQGDPERTSTVVSALRLLSTVGSAMDLAFHAN